MRLTSILPCLTAVVLGATTSFAQDIKVGEFASMTGGSASFGQSSHNGIAMAFDEINAAGGLLGKKVTLVTEDDRSMAGEPSTIARKLISEDQVVAILGEIASSRSLEAAPICQENKIPMISPGSTNAKVTQVGDYIFRACFIDPFQGKVMAKFALSKGWKNAALLIDRKEDYCVGLADAFHDAFTAGGGTIVKSVDYNTGDKDFRAQLTSIKATHPDAIFVPGYYAEVALIARQARQFGIKAPLLGGDGWVGDSLLKVAGNSLDGSFFSNHYSQDDPTPVIQDFVKTYQAKYGEKPDAMAALGYDSAEILADAIKRAGSTAEPALRDAIAGTKDFKGVTGDISLDADRNANKAAVILTIANGGFQFVQRVAP
jgi:branched-chain amino acid transport system substrate-binding protein